jgi:choline dehydrogenase-like flavoprotein
MGTDDMSVVDPHDEGARADGLRVVDASAGLYVTNGNIYAGDDGRRKAADLILAPRRRRRAHEFYRHKKPRKRSTAK